jgi:hypothetical protein
MAFSRLLGDLLQQSEELFEHSCSIGQAGKQHARDVDRLRFIDRARSEFCGARLEEVSCSCGTLMKIGGDPFKGVDV